MIRPVMINLDDDSQIDDTEQYMIVSGDNEGCVLSITSYSRGDELVTVEVYLSIEKTRLLTNALLAAAGEAKE